MKRIIISAVLISIALFLNSCGGANLEGTWKFDPTSVDLVLGEGFPEEMKQGVEEAKKEATSAEAKEEADKMTLELLADGKAIVKHSEHTDDTKEFNWKKSGNVLNFNGEIEGEKFNINLDIIESSANEVTIGFTGESLLEQVKAERPELIDQIPPMLDVEKLVKGAKVSIKMVKA